MTLELTPIAAGPHLCTIADVRAADRALADTAKYPDARIIAAIETAEENLEREAHVAFIPRTCTYTTVGDGGTRLSLPHCAIRSLTSATVGGTALLATIVVREWGALDYALGWTKDKTVVVVYEHGEDAPPAPIVRSCVILAVEELIPSSIPARATATTIGDQMFRVTVAGRDGAFGIPYVDTAIKRFGRRRPVIA